MKPSRLFLLPLVAALAACSHNQHRASAEAAFYQAQAQKAEAGRVPIVEFVARPGESIMLSGVERFAVYAPADPGAAGVVQYRADPNPWPSVLGQLAGVGLQAFGIHRISGVVTTALENAGGNSTVTVGGNQGDTWTDQSRTRIDDRSVSAGGDISVRGDETNTRIRGDEYRDSCVGERCRNFSPGPFIDEDNSVVNPPAPEPDPDPSP